MARKRRLRTGALQRHVPVMLVALLSMRLAAPASWETSVASGALLPTTAAQGDTFTARDAARLLDQIAAGLVGHNRQKTLAAFDMARMPDGPLFAQQVTSFLSHTGIIRVHYNGIEAAMEEGTGVATVDFEMEAEPRDDSLPPVRKQASLRLRCEKSTSGWKIVDLQPRTFFSLSQP